MALLLLIETATNVCSIALSRDGRVVAIEESSGRNRHSAVIIPFIEKVCHDAGLELASIDAVAVSKGPGSYTGLRIGVATAKGLCYALDKPLIAVPTLEAMAVGMGRQSAVRSSQSSGSALLFCPMIDARRMEVFCAIYDNELKEIRETAAVVIDENSFEDLLREHRVVFGGEGAEKCREALEHKENAVFLEDYKASAATMTGPAETKFRNHEFGDLAYFEPFYLKDFIAGKPRVKGLK
jgi:tRNA threonylcarbamoyladenosine biosynthesis protein TsaB